MLPNLQLILLFLLSKLKLQNATLFHEKASILNRCNFHPQ